ncbi:MAG: hypothetical protein M1312_01685 [Patescibacteria group bacterium]|nr:hypothetical protein [Patescibacteria group bacterium]
MSKFRKLMEKYSTPALVNGWFKERSGDRKLPNVDQITNIFYKAARDFKAEKLSLKDFSDICGDLYFDAYLGDRKKFPSSLTIQGKDGGVRAGIVKVRKANGKFVATRLKLSPLKSDLDPKIARALNSFSDPSKKEADRYWRLKKEFHEKYLGFVKWK